MKMANTETTCTETYFAQPYDMGAHGFYFHDLEEFETLSEALRNDYGQPVEEFEIQYIDGDFGALFKAAEVSQSTLGDWLECLESLEDYQEPALFYLMEWKGLSLNEALESLDDCSISSGSLLDAATELADDCYLSDAPEFLARYFDYESFANDLKWGGDFFEFTYDGETYTCTSAND
jgi:Antirestriction protein (ArdA)